ncbi:RNI-like protein [Rhizoclosmatium globosum]|uniref:RNI-like protein n=1 Tax=Rhizoclosmatium globosum TaxID=329046 RepID=A0A1Y2CE58_9FUNG|nr:RNI-like protein [Rhizoclosmatium globosum]|eukprot:ORY45216.1 RNI-like protein [Rhizoclosmatium globosum]
MDSTEHDTLPIEPVSKDPAAEDSIHVIDFLDEYVKQCTIKKVKVIESLRTYLQTSIDDGYIPKSLTLKGSKDDLRENRIDDNGAYVIFRALNNNCYLTVIDLSYNEIGDKGASYIAEFIKTDTRVKRFILKSNNISQQGGALLGKSLMVNDFIQEFDISYNEIGHLGGMEFAATLQVNTTLTKLLLSHCSLSTDALIALSTVLCSTRTIKTLCLSNNENNFSRLTQSCINDIIMHVSHMVKENRGVERLGLAKSGISDFMMVQYLAPAILVNHRIARLDLITSSLEMEACPCVRPCISKSFLPT